MNEPTIDVLDGGRLLTFGLADLMRYHGPGFPGGVAHAFTVLAAAPDEVYDVTESG